MPWKLLTQAWKVMEATKSKGREFKDQTTMETLLTAVWKCSVFFFFLTKTICKTHINSWERKKFLWSNICSREVIKWWATSGHLIAWWLKSAKPSCLFFFFPPTSNNITSTHIYIYTSSKAKICWNHFIRSRDLLRETRDYFATFWSI